MRKLLPLVFLLAGCASAQKKNQDCLGGNQSACFSLGKKCARGDRDACHYMSRLTGENREMANAGTGAGPGWFQQNGPALMQGLDEMNNTATQRDQQMVCTQTGICN